ncbi:MULTISPECIES: carbohydrate ABC transporter permease [Paracoccus]|jgi:trehalose/maltose transport system permease protein|uniref:Carbohydrate ABC transporter membrane protein 2, CUT1 family n=1 Tax=Paracoccus denitrificans (strain Pd 1222) TaxID=318586 RepID=A1BAG0_PARDP|nr:MULTISPECIES: carbohydrate ABC transporter permease [Paracoccus]ABL72504.1 carbohydrate ABC transporter membrane protein 2, CUT1 family [Paracoccus denitrificans PD1222]MBB4626496.1 trehalose/maltose transport system permease protein [Paracoccus denitrificans]MCU7428862.1 carbohydrate ABC transporter permease [Paracoccus denitrificans]MDK8872997.1 carbohydrate ABC transporter permease [Paracoccus sp. SSJ]QAR29048.1 carbohydrate ABC transporter permease [Paracoccus denitrificans]
MTRHKLLKRIGFYALVAVIVVFSVFPFYYAVVTSFASGTALFRVNYLPSGFDLRNYQAVLGSKNFLYSIGNSLIIATLTVGLSLFLGVTASYALARVRFRGRGLLLMTILAVSMFPQIAVLAGLFELVRFLGIFNTHWAMILSYTIFTLPFTVWVLTTFMRDLPVEIEEAAIVDGASPWIIITRVFLPLLWPAMVTTGLLAFIGAWNEFLFALTFTSTESMRTVPVAIGLLSGASEQEIPWGPIMAASVIVTVPLIVLVLIFQRKIVAGLTAGGVKG